MFFLSYKRVMTRFFTIFEDFPKLFRRPDEQFRRLPKIAEDCQRRPKKIQRRFNHTPTNFSCSLRDKREMLSNMISSHVRILYRFYQFVTTPYATDFYTIKAIILKERQTKILWTIFMSKIFSRIECHNRNYQSQLGLSYFF